VLPPGLVNQLCAMADSLEWLCPQRCIDQAFRVVGPAAGHGIRAIAIAGPPGARTFVLLTEAGLEMIARSSSRAREFLRPLIYLRERAVYQAKPGFWDRGAPLFKRANEVDLPDDVETLVIAEIDRLSLTGGATTRDLGRCEELIALPLLADTTGRNLVEAWSWSVHSAIRRLLGGMDLQ
jgi:hypothetical protein